LILVRALWGMGGFDMRSSCLPPAVNSPLLVFMVQCPVTDDVEARTRQELVDILAALTELTGLPSRWSGRVELVPEAEFKGRKRPICDIQLDADSVTKDSRRATLVHEAIHGISVGYNSSDFRQFRGWEEGVVEQLQRIYRPVVLGRLGISVASEVFHAEEEVHAFNGYIAALESLRLMLKGNASANAKQEFYLDLLALPIAARPDGVLRVSFALEPPQRGVFISAFSRSDSILKLRVSR